jgi:hypothetical protein
MNFLQRQFEDPVRFARIRRWSYAALGAVAVAEIVLPRIFHSGELHFSFEAFPAWSSLYGFVSSVVIIVVSKLIGKLWLMRREDHYDR